MELLVHSKFVDCLRICGICHVAPGKGHLYPIGISVPGAAKMNALLV
jgi:hypothetical protein